MLNRRSFLKWMALFSSGIIGRPELRWQAAGSGQRYFIPPTVLHLSESHAHLYFRLAQHTKDGLLRVWPADDPQDVSEIPFSTDEVLRKEIVIEGLNPATHYAYQLLVDGAELPVLNDDAPWSDLSFRTPPYEWPLRVIAVGDSGFGQRATFELAEHMATLPADLFLHLGDIVYWMNEYDNDHFRNWHEKYFKPFKNLLRHMPHYPTFGNHDLDAPTWLDDWPSYYWMFPPINEDNHEGARMWCSFDYNNIQFLSLNSQLFYSYPQLRNTQNDWLDEKLARDDVLYTVVFCHVSPYTSTAPHQWDGNLLVQNWIPKFEAANVPLIISGHAHAYERLKRNNLNYIVGGGGSATIYGLGEPLAHSQRLWRVTSYPYFEFYPDRIHLTAYGLGGEVLDDLDLTW